MVDVSSPEWRLDGAVMVELREIEFRLASTFSLFIASLRRFDIGSIAQSAIDTPSVTLDGTDLYQRWRGIRHLTSDDSCPFAEVLG